MTTQTHQPWKPTCWVGGWLLPASYDINNPWIEGGHKELELMRDSSRQKYAATKATAAILRSMRK